MGAESGTISAFSLCFRTYGCSNGTLGALGYAPAPSFPAPTGNLDANTPSFRSCPGISPQRLPCMLLCAGVLSMGAPMGAELGTIGAFPLCFRSYGCSKWDVGRSGTIIFMKNDGSRLVEIWANRYICPRDAFCIELFNLKCARYERLGSMYEHYSVDFPGLVGR